MAKAHRGAGIRDQHSHARGTCPVCNRSAIKVMYEQEVNGTKAQVCKQCNAKMQHAK
jgi:transcription elongation factor Elf1